MKQLLVAMLVMVVGCGKHDPRPEEAWTVSDYASAGLRIDRPWTADDYVAAAKTLEQVCSGHRERLPRFHGRRSGPVFDRLILDLPDDSARPIAERFIAHSKRADALSAIAKLYLANTFATPSRDWIELMGADLREAVVLSNLSGPLLDSFGPNDPKHETRLQGLEKMKVGYGQMLLGGLLVADQLRVPEDDRVAMLAHVTAALPTLFPRSPPPLQQQIRDTLAKEVAAFPAGKLRDAARAAQHALPD